MSSGPQSLEINSSHHTHHSLTEASTSLQTIDTAGETSAAVLTNKWLVTKYICGVTLLFSFGVLVGYVYNSHSHTNMTFVNKGYTENAQSSSFQASVIAFGSCTGYDLRPLTIWTEAIIPAQPDVWIWTGDMVYLDDNEINCRVYQDTDAWQGSCNCSASWLEKPPYRCKAGDIDYANQRWVETLNNNEYNSFLDFMCPRSRSLGYFPPRGSDPSVCDRAIFGIYDDHDFGYVVLKGYTALATSYHIFTEFY